MVFSYPILTDAEMEAQRKTLEDGIHPYKVIDAIEGVSKNSDPMVTLTLEIWNDEGKSFTVKDWLIGTTSMAWKTKAFWVSAGRPERYELGNIFTDEFINQTGYLTTVLKKGANGDRKFPNVASYEPPVGKTSTPSLVVETAPDDLDDDIPF
jgi:hypothetical protein